MRLLFRTRSSTDAPARSIKDDRLPTTPTPTRTRTRAQAGEASPGVLVACPDARPPAYQAAAGLARSGHLRRFLTGYYSKGYGPATALVRKLAPCHLARFRRALLRRHHPEIPAIAVRTVPSFDLALAVENRVGPSARRLLARARTRRFDRALARRIERERPDVVLAFSDVASEFALPTCRRLGIASILSMVHGDVREERVVLDREAVASPDFFPIYLGDGRLDPGELDWLHARRLRDVELADLVLVPSDHIARALARHGTPADKIRVVPYAADTRRFRPDPDRRPDASTCTFLFAGGITQRKGIKYLLEAWRLARRPGWRLQLLGPLPADPGPLAGYLDEVEWLGRVGHGEMPARMAAADVFVFPSLFEGSAVVTYEALASGLPSIVTAESGSVARDGIDGLFVPAGSVPPLARAMERLGLDPDLRRAMAISARRRAEAFGWDRYHAALESAVREVVARDA